MMDIYPLSSDSPGGDTAGVAEQGTSGMGLTAGRADADDLLQRPPAERILITAHDLFYRHGIRATGIDRVIEASGVAKKTFYRHYPSKDALILAFLDYRHTVWMQWFTDALTRHGGTAAAIVPALADWFDNGIYRGCAFINAVAEVGPALPEAVIVSRQHKRDMTAAIVPLLPASPWQEADAEALAVAIDGAIVSAQFNVPLSEDGSTGALAAQTGADASVALRALQRIVDALTRQPAP
jgi:AcrR family transcriptional regulator